MGESVDKGEERALAYILRLWRVRNGSRSVWRVSLQDVRSGERRGFAGLDQLCRYLRARIGDTPDREEASM